MPSLLSGDSIVGTPKLVNVGGTLWGPLRLNTSCMAGNACMGPAVASLVTEDDTPRMLDVTDRELDDSMLDCDNAGLLCVRDTCGIETLLCDTLLCITLLCGSDTLLCRDPQFWAKETACDRDIDLSW